MLWQWRGKGTQPRGRDWGTPQGLVGSGPTPGKATKSHSPAARRPPRPSDGPGARGGCGGPSAADNPALVSTLAASASLSLCRSPTARTRPLLTSPRGFGSRQGKGWNQHQIPPPFALRTRCASPSQLTHGEPGAAVGTAHAQDHYPAFRYLKRLCRGMLVVTVRTRASPQAVFFPLALWDPTASVRETPLYAPPLSLTHFPDLARMRVSLCRALYPSAVWQRIPL